MRERGAVAALLVALTGTPARADDADSVRARIAEREATLAQFSRTYATVARQQARAAYRLARQAQLGFVLAPEARLEHERAMDQALYALRRSTAEARAYRDELERVRAEERTIETATRRPADAPTGDPPRLARPVRGPLVGEPGTHRDQATGVELRQDAVQILARVNAPVLAPAPGQVRRIELLPQGSFAVVIEHEGGFVSIVSGLRDVSVSAGDEVDAEAQLGLSGRNLDGAPVVSLELWRGRTPLDPRPLLAHGHDR